MIFSESYDTTKQIFDELPDEKKKEFIDLFDVDEANFFESKEDAEKWIADNDEEEYFF